MTQMSFEWSTGTLAQRLECSPMARETWVQSQVGHTKDFKNGT